MVGTVQAQESRVTDLTEEVKGGGTGAVLRRSVKISRDHSRPIQPSHHILLLLCLKLQQAFKVPRRRHNILSNFFGIDEMTGYYKTVNHVDYFHYIQSRIDLVQWYLGNTIF